MAKPGRKKKVTIEPEQTIKNQGDEITPENGQDCTEIECTLPQKDLFRIDEVAVYFDVSEQAIRLWIQHGHLRAEKHRGILRVPRESIVRCRFNAQVV
ncbi:MAG: helix-turn-helix domain-containing protein [Gammaproteobacteria bacterium]